MYLLSNYICKSSLNTLKILDCKLKIISDNNINNILDSATFDI